MAALAVWAALDFKCKAWYLCNRLSIDSSSLVSTCIFLDDDDSNMLLFEEEKNSLFSKLSGGGVKHLIVVLGLILEPRRMGGVLEDCAEKDLPEGGATSVSAAAALTLEL